jgi:two-component system, cell cycle sensor histidine kinase and response regulator CckA
MSDALHLFLVEDDEEVAFLIRLHLERAGFRVTACRTGADALIVLGNTPFDLVLLDNWLPDMQGLDLLETLGREGVRTPVFVITAHSEIRSAIQALKAGALDYVVKDDNLEFIYELPKRVQVGITRHRLQESNQLLIAALESARDGICITDREGTMINVNSALEKMTGYNRDELLGNTPRLFKSGAHEPDFYTSLWRTVISGQSWQGELVNRRKDGQHYDVSLTVSPIVDAHGKLTHFVGIYRDITDRKQLERQLLQAQKMQSVGTLAGGVAHEFNNLLAGIQGYASLGLREPSLPPSVKEFLQYIVDLSDRAANLTRQLLAFARKPALRPQPTLMARLLNTTADLVRHSLHLEVEVEIEENERESSQPTRALADANQLQQVLINLALNARDASTRPQPIYFRMRRAVLTADFPAFPESVPPGDYVVLEVVDRGKGMTAEVLNQALFPFFTTKEIGKGTGLGLSVASGIVHGHKGWLTIASVPDEGTTVGLYLPRLTTPMPAALSEQADSGSVEPQKSIRRDILVVDDEQAVLDVVRRFLEIAGHTVTCVTTGSEALQRLAERQRFDLIVLDLMIPREDGTATYRLMRQNWPDLPVLLCTGLLHTDPGATAVHGEPVNLLRKPFKMNDLWQAVNEALAGPAKLQG